ncbi:hypothetical protein RTP6_001703 [Batrachochytrium dendrobatidis]
MSMADGATGKQIWKSTDWSHTKQIESSEDDIKAVHIPSSILKCSSVARCLEFSTIDAIQHLNLHQRVLLGDECVEEWHFDFGFVIPNSTNSWDMEMQAAPPDQMLPAELMSGKLIIETRLMDETKVIHLTRTRVFYT